MSDFTIFDYLKAMNDNREMFKNRSRTFKDEIINHLKDTPRICDFVKAEDGDSLKLSFAGIHLPLNSRERIVFDDKEPLLEFDFFTINDPANVSVLKVFFDTHGQVILGSHSNSLKYDFINEPICSEFFHELFKSAYDKGIISV